DLHVLEGVGRLLRELSQCGTSKLRDLLATRTTVEVAVTLCSCPLDGERAHLGAVARQHGATVLSNLCAPGHGSWAAVAQAMLDHGAVALLPGLLPRGDCATIAVAVRALLHVVRKSDTAAAELVEGGHLSPLFGLRPERLGQAGMGRVASKAAQLLCHVAKGAVSKVAVAQQGGLDFLLELWGSCGRSASMDAVASPPSNGGGDACPSSPAPSPPVSPSVSPPPLPAETVAPSAVDEPIDSRRRREKATRRVCAALRHLFGGTDGVAAQLPLPHIVRLLEAQVNEVTLQCACALAALSCPPQASADTPPSSPDAGASFSPPPASRSTLSHGDAFGGGTQEDPARAEPAGSCTDIAQGGASGHPHPSALDAAPAASIIDCAMQMVGGGQERRFGDLSNDVMEEAVSVSSPSDAASWSGHADLTADAGECCARGCSARKGDRGGRG
ncbi:hypothetical protein CYMTET_31767, partial [Cymbomonas tetramitiformis]